jgi:DNA repair protein RadC
VCGISGEAIPSEADRRITQRLAEAGRIIQINLIDHLIVGANTCYSFRVAGLL